MLSTRASRRAHQTEQRARNALERMSPQATTVILVRHGETDWNLEHRLQGQLQPGPPLNAEGIQQAHVVAERLRLEPIAAVYSSDLARAEQSAAVIAAAAGLQAASTPELRERHLGDLTGLTYAEVQSAMPQAFQMLRSRSRDTSLPGGGESLNTLQRRAHAAVTQLATSHPGQTIVLVVHGGFLHACYRQATGEDYPAPNVNCAMNTVRVDGTAGWGLLSWADTDHLGDTGRSGNAFGGGTVG